eukprot:m.444121 g.444121  ORF g.444121 m.444121 type:complete len:97 (-) comp20296_c1_seq2:3141-3431(-)
MAQRSIEVRIVGTGPMTPVTLSVSLHTAAKEVVAQCLEQKNLSVHQGGYVDFAWQLIEVFEFPPIERSVAGVVQAPKLGGSLLRVDEQRPSCTQDP